MLGNTRRRAVAIGAVAIALTTGCAGYMMVEEPASAVIVMRAPPPPRREVIVMAPSPGLVWVDGYWSWDHRDYIWIPGRWAIPPGQYKKWERGKWQHGKRGWYYVEGRWR